MTSKNREAPRPAAGAPDRDVVFFSVDVEASGPVPGLYNLVSIGAVPIRRLGGSWRPADDRFYIELRPVCDGFDPEAMAVHGIPRAHLEQAGAPAEEALRALSSFVARHRGAEETAVFAGHNAVFDWAFISWYYVRFGIDNPFGYKALEIKSLAMGRLGIGWLATSKENLKTLLPGLPDQDAAQVHRADYDALYQAWILCGLLNLGGVRRRAG
jgi:DNA polymerase III epsilon subunit-like protein